MCGSVLHDPYSLPQSTGRLVSLGIVTRRGPIGTQATCVTGLKACESGKAAMGLCSVVLLITDLTAPAIEQRGPILYSSATLP